jgi:hypothetical protein
MEETGEWEVKAKRKKERRAQRKRANIRARMSVKESRDRQQIKNYAQRLESKEQ